MNTPSRIAAGTRLGPYEIVSRIGAGGMGEVFRARDTRLERAVAIKVLPTEFAADAQLRLRFEREAKTISQLTHPNICTLHDVGNENGVSYLVMELIEGESLADRLSRGPLPIEDVMRYGAQIADALAKAHRHGVVHRDLKPGNVMITKAGAKLLDFGLAKPGAIAPASGVTVVLNGETERRPLTAEGTILGTFQYMAPEQLEGAEADARTDIFALGSLLYEMATGRRAFQGKNKTSLIASIVSAQPQPISELQPLTPPAFERVVQRCLRKDADDRWQSAHDVAEELRWIAGAGSAAGVAAPLVARRKRRDRLAVIVAIAAAVIAIGAIAAWLRARQPAAAPVESVILPPDRYTFTVASMQMAAAPDGSALAVLVLDAKGVRSLAVRPLAATSYRFLEGTEDAVAPFWSPDSKRIAFFSRGALKVIDAAGGQITKIADAPVPRGGAWGPDDTIVFAPTVRGPLMKVPAAGGPVVPATKLAAGEGSHRMPSFFPHSDRFVYAALLQTTATVFEGSLADPSTRRAVVTDTDFALPAIDGWLLYARGTARATPTLVAQRLTRSHELTGNAVVLAESVASGGSGSGIVATADRVGNLFFARGAPYPLSELVWVDRSGHELERVGAPAVYFAPALSHDGRRLAVDVSDATTGQGDIWIHDLLHKRATRLTYEPGNESSPVWSADDRHIVYDGDALGQDDLYQIATGGTGGAERVYVDQRAKRATALSRDGQWLIFNSGPTRTAQATDVWAYSYADKTAHAWLATPFAERAATLSPDGKWMAYQSDESGHPEIYVRAFPQSDEKWPISAGGGVAATWRADGRELYYVGANHKMMAVKVNPGATFDADTPVELFDADVRDHAARQYDVSPDGTRFLLNRLVEHRPPEPVTIVQNWTARIGR